MPSEGYIKDKQLVIEKKNASFPAENDLTAAEKFSGQLKTLAIVLGISTCILGLLSAFLLVKLGDVEADFDTLANNPSALSSVYENQLSMNRDDYNVGLQGSGSCGGISLLAFIVVLLIRRKFQSIAADRREMIRLMNDEYRKAKADFISKHGKSPD